MGDVMGVAMAVGGCRQLKQLLAVNFVIMSFAFHFGKAALSCVDRRKLYLIDTCGNY